MWKKVSSVILSLCDVCVSMCMHGCFLIVEGSLVGRYECEWWSQTILGLDEEMYIEYVAQLRTLIHVSYIYYYYIINHIL